MSVILSGAKLSFASAQRTKFTKSDEQGINMTLHNIRRSVPASLLRRTLTKKLAGRKIKITPVLLAFFVMSYHAYAKKLAKLSRLLAISQKKRIITSQQLIENHELILQRTKVKRKQRTLDEMLHRKSSK